MHAYAETIEGGGPPAFVVLVLVIDLLRGPNTNQIDYEDEDEDENHISHFTFHVLRIPGFPRDQIEPIPRQSVRVLPRLWKATRGLESCREFRGLSEKIGKSNEATTGWSVRGTEVPFQQHC